MPKTGYPVKPLTFNNSHGGAVVGALSAVVGAGIGAVVGVPTNHYDHKK